MGRTESMNSHERVEAALNFEEPDRPPLSATFTPEIAKLLRKTYDIQEQNLGAAMGHDLVMSSAGLEMSFYGKPRPEYVDDWGIRWKYQDNPFCSFTEIVEHPLAGDKSKLDDFAIPDPDAPAQYDEFRELKSRYGREKWMVGSSQITVFEAAWYLRGLEQLMLDMAMDPDYCHALFDKVMAFPLGASGHFIDLGADMVWFGDDVSMQQGMLISPDMWREFLKPRFARIFSECKSRNPNIKIAYHSCGNCEAVLDEMVDIGLDVLNPVQPTAIDPFKIKKRFGKRLALFGGMCVQHVLPHGSPEEVRATVAALKKGCGAGGGFILSPAHHIQADTPLENIRVFYEEALKTVD